MFRYAYDFVVSFGLSGIYLCLTASALLTFVILISVIFIGFIVNKFETLEYKFFCHFTSPKKASNICNYVTFPGVMIHELSHAFMAWFTGAKVTEIRLLESSSSGRLGHVNFVTRGSKSRRALQLALISCAPVLTGMILLPTFLRVVFFRSLSTGWICFFWYIFVSVANHMSMSNADIKNYLKGMLRMIPIMFFVSFFVIYLLIDK